MGPSSRPGDVPIGLGAQLLRHGWRYSAGAVLLVIYWASQFLFNRELRRGIDAASRGDPSLAFELGVGLLLLALGAFAARVFSRLAIFNGGRIAEYELRQALFEKLQQLGPSFYGRVSSGDVMSRMTSDLQQVRLLLGFGVLNALNTVLALTASLAFMLDVSLRLTLASLASLPLLMLVMRFFSAQMFARQHANQVALGGLSGVVQSSISGIRLVRSFGLEREELRRFDGSNDEYLEKSLALARVRGLFTPLLQAVTALGVIVVFWYGGTLVLDGSLSEGAFVAFYNALGQLAWPLISLGFAVAIIQRGRAGHARLRELYDTVPEVTDGPLPAQLGAKGALEVKDLSFRYPAAAEGQLALDHVSFSLPAGGSLAIVGRTGSGKSTLVALLVRLLPTPPGSVFLDGIDVCELPVGFVRGTLGLAQQDAFLFSTTAGRNVGLVLDEPEAPESWEAIRRASGEAEIQAEIERLPHGFHTVVGERGLQLSGGQKQRLALARAFVAEHRVLLLDDPVSAVDARTEGAILDALERERQRRGLILVTHRVSAAARCEHVLVLDGGRVVEFGTHDELLRGGGIYARFAEEQRLEGEIEALSERERAEEQRRPAP